MSESSNNEDPVVENKQLFNGKICLNSLTFFLLNQFFQSSSQISYFNNLKDSKNPQ